MEPKKRSLLIQGLLAAALVGPALALGAVHLPVLAGFCVLAGCLLLMVAGSKTLHRPPLDLPGAALLALAAFTALQLMPLPAGWVEILSPADYDVRLGALRPLGAPPPGWMPLTLDASLTAAKLLELLFFLAIYWTVQSVATTKGSRPIFRMVVVTGTAAALVFLGHRLLLAHQVYGFFEPLQLPPQVPGGLAPTRLSAPLINENHLAGLLGLCAAVAIGQALNMSRRTVRLLMVSCAALMGGALMLTLSRGGIAAFIGGQCLFILLRVVHRLQNRDTHREQQHLAWLPLGLAFSLGLGLLAAYDPLLSEFTAGGLEKLDLAKQGLNVVTRFWEVGAGRGAFAVALPLVSDRSAATTATHPENILVQLPCDFGWVVGIAALLVFAVAVGRLLLRTPKRVTYAAALAALVAFAVQNLVDFNSEVPGVAVIAVTLLALVQSRRIEHLDKERPRPVRRIARPVLAALAAVTIGATALVFFLVSGRAVDEEERRYHEAFVEGDGNLFTPEALGAVLARHPASWYIPYIVGVRAFHSGRENPVPWLSRALELNAAAGVVHLYIGRSLLRANHVDQALLELRIAAERKPALTATVAADIVRGRLPIARVLRMAPTAEQKLRLWPALADAFAGASEDGKAETLDVEMLTSGLEYPWSLARQARRLASRNQFDQAIALAQKLGKVKGYAVAGALLDAELEERRGHAEKSLAVLQAALKDNPRSDQLISQLAWTQLRAKQTAAALGTIQRLSTIATSDASRAAYLSAEANLELAAGRTQSAIATCREALSLDPNNLTVLRQYASFASTSAEPGFRLDALTRLGRAEPDNEAVKRELDALKDALIHPPITP